MEVGEHLSMEHIASERIYSDYKESDGRLAIDVYLFRQSFENAKEEHDMIVILPFKLDDNVMQKYMKFHRKYVQNTHEKKRKLTMCYDLRQIIDASYKYVNDIAKFQTELRTTYENILQCTIIMVNNAAVSAIINFVFTKLYEPTRPVRMLNNCEEAKSFIDLVMSSKNVDIYSTT